MQKELALTAGTVWRGMEKDFITNQVYFSSYFNGFRIHITEEAPYSRFLHSRFHYSRIEKLRPNSHIRGLKFLYSRIDSKYRCVT